MLWGGIPGKFCSDWLEAGSLHRPSQSGVSLLIIPALPSALSLGRSQSFLGLLASGSTVSPPLLVSSVTPQLQSTKSSPGDPFLPWLRSEQLLPSFWMVSSLQAHSCRSILQLSPAGPASSDLNLEDTPAWCSHDAPPACLALLVQLPRRLLPGTGHLQFFAISLPATPQHCPSSAPSYMTFSCFTAFLNFLRVL